MRVVWSSFARTTRTRLVDFIAEDNPEAALEMLERIEESVAGLSQFPQMGKVGRIPGTRELVIHKNYVVVYTHTDEMLVIVVILHASQQWPSVD